MKVRPVTSAPVVRAHRPPMRVLAITKLFPNRTDPWSAPFNRQQIVALSALCTVHVWATIPWFPGRNLFFHRGADRAPRRDTVEGVEVEHPRTLYIPRALRSLSALLYAISIFPRALRLRPRPDVILGSWAYPDACAAIAIARAMGVPAVVKVHGSDLDVVAKMPGPRAIMRALLPRAAAVIAVSRPLARDVAALGVPPDRIHTVDNGVDSQRFFVRDRKAARALLGLPVDGKLLVYIGHLKRSKGIRELCAAYAIARQGIPDLRLVIVGDGEERQSCDQFAACHDGRVVVAGAWPHEHVPLWLAAADALVLPSWHEGTPNVVLEALACGRRVVATRVGGTPDLITSAKLGDLCEVKNPHGLALAMIRAACTPYDPAQVAAMGSRGDWHRSAAALYRILAQVSVRRARAP